MTAHQNGGKKAGTLYIVATPIGNLQDLTFRALETLKSVQLIACEDTRRAGILLRRYQIKKQLISYYQPREKQKLPLLLRKLQDGFDVALISDAGTPGISDPGYLLIRDAIQAGIQVVPIPGASAFTAALAASGLPTHRFLFLGFPPAKKQGCRKLLESLSEESVTLIFYLPPRKLPSFLKMIEEILPERRIVIARELTKIHEEFLRGTAGELAGSLPGTPVKGEVTVLIEGVTRAKSIQ
jgi:16S rRNA (cytidine1402-2'-O)-methyltransferase